MIQQQHHVSHDMTVHDRVSSTVAVDSADDTMSDERGKKFVPCMALIG